MSRIYKLIFILILLTPFSVSATHVLGAEFEWEEVGKDTFVISVNVYRDCNGVNLSATPFTLLTSCGSARLNTSRFLIGDVTPVCPSVDSRCANRSSSFKYGIEKYRLAATYVVNQSWKNNGCCDVTLTWAQCCRNGAITTGAANQNYYLQGRMNICSPSSVNWNNAAVAMSCLGHDVTLDQSITTDNPSDSIVYGLTPTLTSATSSTSWSGSYDYDAPLYFLGFPKTNLTLPRGFHMDKEFGELSFRPMKEEVTVLGVKASIYRNGKLFAEVTRDIQYIVYKCASNNPPELSGFDLKDASPKNFSRIICAGHKSCFNISADDKDSKDSVKLTFNGKIGDSFAINNTNAKYQKGTFCWTPDSSFISDKFHSFAITAKDNACPGIGSQTKLYKIKVKKESTIKPELQNRDLQKCGDYLFKVVDKDSQDIASLEWFLNDTINLGSKDSFKYTFTKTGTHIIMAQIIDCDTINVYDTINVTNVNKLAINLKDTGLCATETLKLDPQVSGNKGSITYKWNIDKAFNYKGKDDTSVLVLDLSKAWANTIKPITLQISDTNDCVLEKEIEVTTKAVNLVNIESSKNICEGDFETLELDQYNGKGYWTGANVKNNKMSLDGLNPGKYLMVFRLEQELGCIYDTALISFNALPNVGITNNDFTTCVGARATELNASPKLGTWSGTGLSSGSFSPALSGKGTFELIYSFKDSLGCSNEDTLHVEVFDYKPSVSVTDTVKACESDDEAVLKASKSGGNWVGSGIAGNSNPMRFSPADFGSGSFEVYYNYTDSNQCSTTETSVIVIAEAPLISIRIKDSVIKKGDTINIANNTINQNGASFSWSIGNPAFITSTSTNLKEVIDTVGEFDLMLIAEDATTGCIDTLIEEKAFKVVLGTGFAFSESDFNIYPNPASTLIIIDTKMDIEFVGIYSMDGRQVKTIQNPNTNTIDVSTLEKGMYLLKIQGAKSSFNYTFIKD